MLTERLPTKGEEATGGSTSFYHHSNSDRPSQGNSSNSGSGISVISSRHIELTPFYQVDSWLWFAQVDLVFANFNITSDTTKFKYVATQLSGKALRSVSDLVINPPIENKYESIKRHVMSAYDEGDEARLRRLLRGHEMRDEKPTAYLHRLQALVGNQCGDAVIHSLFFEQLPEVIQAILAISDTADLQRLAEMADKAPDVMKPTVAAA
ncbi:uncharacterized protein [Anoplolepis gracilipes]|uniref:uncharacterized protein n=1 Tax=Anoplolepis gracilipes TaxID=354296 RepID=UPI003BA339AF